MKKQQLLLIGLSLLAFASCSEKDITGNGLVISEVRAVNQFHSIKSEISADIYLTQDASQSLRLETNENVMAILDTRVVNGELRIESDYIIKRTDQVQVYISATDFRKISITGSGSMESMNCMDLDDLELIISGSANINFCGVADNFKSKISGSGDINAYGLATKTADLTITGSGKIELTVSETLDARITGSGDVRYKGNPTC